MNEQTKHNSWETKLFVGGETRAQSSMRRRRRFGEYEILSEIARGGMGVVYRARQRGLNRTVALKRIRGAALADQETVDRFVTEAEAAAQLSHVGIVPIYEIGEQDGEHYFSMAYIDGSSLFELISDNPLKPETAARILSKVAAAIHYAHQAGVLHRDIKPGNILLDRDGQPRVTDFGLAKRIEQESRLTQTGQVLGTPAYMSPEQARGETHQVGAAADIYSLGAVLYAMLSGRPPFHAATPLKTLEQVTKAEPVSITHVAPETPRDLATICHKCLQKQPGRRYQTAEELRQDLERFLDGAPVVARPIGPVGRLWRWCRRNRVVASLSFSLVLVLVLATIVSTSFWLSEKRQRIRATRNEREARQRAYDAILSNSQLLVSTEVGQNGWTWKALDNLESLSRLDVPHRDDYAIRNLLLKTLWQLDVRRLGTIEVPGNALIADMSFAPDGRLFLAESKKVPQCRIWEVAKGVDSIAQSFHMNTLSLDYFSRLLKQEKFQTGFRSVAVSPNNRWVGAGTRFGKLVIFDRHNPAQPPVIYKAHQGEVCWLQFSPDSRRLYSINKHGERLLVVSEMTDGVWRRSGGFRVDGADASLRADGQQLTVAKGGGVRVASLDSFDTSVLAPGHDQPTYSPDGSFIVARGPQDNISLLDAVGHEIGCLDSNHPRVDSYGGDSKRFLGESSFLVAANSGDTEGVHVHDLQGIMAPVIIKTPGHPSPEFTVNDSGDVIAVADGPGVATYQVRLPIVDQIAPRQQTRVDSLRYQVGGQLSVCRTQFHEPQRFTSFAVAQYGRAEDAVQAEFSTASHERFSRNHWSRSSPVCFDDSGELAILADPILGLHLRDCEGTIRTLQARSPKGQMLRIPIGKEILVAGSPLVIDIDEALRETSFFKTQFADMEKDHVYQVFVNVVIKESLGGPVQFKNALQDRDRSRHRCGGTVGSHVIGCGRRSVEEIRNGCALSVSLDWIGTEGNSGAAVAIESVVLSPSNVIDGRLVMQATGPVAISSNGTLVWGVDDTDMLVCWDAETGKSRYLISDHWTRILKGASGIQAIAVHSGILAVGSRSGGIRIWSAADGDPVADYNGIDSEVVDLAFLSKHELLVVINGGVLGVLNWKQDRFVEIANLGESILHCSSSADGDRIVYASKDRSYVLSKISGRWQRDFEMGPFRHPISSVAISPDGTAISVSVDSGLSMVSTLELPRLRERFKKLGVHLQP